MLHLKTKNVCKPTPKNESSLDSDVKTTANNTKLFQDSIWSDKADKSTEN